MPMYQRPPFWRVPHQRRDPENESRDFGQRKRVTPGTPAGRELVRGDIIAKIDDYDARDLRHEDAQNLFKNAQKQIKLVVQRGIPSSHDYMVPRTYGRFISRVPTPTFYHDFAQGGSSSHLYSVPRASGSFVGRVPTPTFYHELAEDVDREASAGARQAPRSPVPNVAAAYRTPSPMPPTAYRGPESLPRTPVPPYSYPPFPVQQEGEYRSLLLSPASTRTDDTVDESIGSQGAPGAAVCDRALNDTRLRHLVFTMANPNFFPNGYQDEMHPEEEVVTNWPYRTTPLVLPGAKVRREPGPTESYLRHHPNPSMRAPPHHDYRDTLMKQKMVHKQFNSPINMYSDQNIANTIRQQSSPLPHKPTVLYDPAKSETFRALQEEGLGDVVEEVPVPIQPKVFTAPPNKRPAPTPKPNSKQTTSSEVVQNGKQTTFVNSLHEEHIQQSNSFKRLMYHVLGDTEF